MSHQGEIKAEKKAPRPFDLDSLLKTQEIASVLYPATALFSSQGTINNNNTNDNNNNNHDRLPTKRSSRLAGRKPRITSQSARPKVLRKKKKKIAEPSISHYEAAVVMAELADFSRTSENSSTASSSSSSSFPNSSPSHSTRSSFHPSHSFRPVFHPSILVSKDSI